MQKYYKKKFFFNSIKNYKSLTDLTMQVFKYNFFFHKKIHNNNEIILKILKFKFLNFKGFFIGCLLRLFYFNLEKIKIIKGKIFKFLNNNNILLLDIESGIILKINIKNINILILIFEFQN
jgi:hypothetical protein